MKILKAASVMVLLVFAAGCASSWVVRDITKLPTQKTADQQGNPITRDIEKARQNNPPEETDEVKTPARRDVLGIPFRMKVPHTVRLFARDAQGTTRK